MSKLENTIDALESRNKEYNKIKRFLLSLQQEDEEESMHSQNQSSVISYENMDTLLFSFWLK